MLRLRIADVVIGLEAAADGPPAEVDGAAAAFVVGAGTPDVHVRAEWGDVEAPRGRRLFDSGGLWQLHEQDDGQLVYSFRSPLYGSAPYRTAAFDPQFSRGVVTLDRRSFSGRRPASPLEYPLDELTVINRLVEQGGVEIHGCGIIDDNGTGWLFAGQSGAGKSTLSRLCAGAGAMVVSDDRVVLRTGPDGITMFGTPWHGDAEYAEPLRAPLSRILFLRHAPANQVETLAAARAAALLFSCAFPVFHDRRALDTTLRLLAEIVRTVPIGILHFAPTPAVTQLLRGGL